MNHAHEAVAAFPPDAVCDAIDYGIAVLASGGRLLFANAAARRELRASESVQVDAHGHLRAVGTRDDDRLTEARVGACLRGLRRMIHLSDGRGPVLSVSAIASPDGASQPCCLVLFSRRAPCERLALDQFARLQGLTPVETEVLDLLVRGIRPNQIAEQRGVRLCTVRTHIGKILGKSDFPTLRDLVCRVSTLPPISDLKLATG